MLPRTTFSVVFFCKKTKVTKKGNFCKKTKVTKKGKAPIYAAFNGRRAAELHAGRIRFNRSTGVQR